MVDHTLPQPPNETATAGGRRWNPMWTVRVMHMALWVIVAAGPLFAVAALTETASLRRHLTTLAALTGPVPVDTTEPEGLAALVAAEHLTAAGWTVTETVTVDAVEVAPGVVAVTIAVHAVGPVSGASEDADSLAPVPEQLFLAVAMADTGAGWVALGPPSVVSGPVVEVLSDGPRGARLDATPGLDTAVAGFLGAYLTGDGDVERYIAPDAAVVAVVPPPFTTVEITQAAVTRTDDGALTVSVVIDGATPAGASLESGYRLVVGERDGRFEVSQLGPMVHRFERGGSS